MTNIELLDCELGEFEEYATLQNIFSKNDGIRYKLPCGEELSVISHFGSYGGRQGLFETWDRINEPIGYLDLSEVKKVVRGYFDQGVQYYKVHYKESEELRCSILAVQD